MKEIEMNKKEIELNIDSKDKVCKNCKEWKVSDNKYFYGVVGMCKVEKYVMADIGYCDEYKERE